MLKSIGLRPEWTMSGREAILRTQYAMNEKEPYQVYIIDWLMPDINGVEVVRRIRMEIGEHMPIIVLTAYDWTDIEQEARAAGVTAFCSKPLFLSELRDVLVTAGGYEKNREIVEADEESESLNDKFYKGKRILVVEDTELNMEISKIILIERGFLVDGAQNGAIAVDMIKKVGVGYYDLILMDVQMPVMDGYDATKAIREIEGDTENKIPIFAMTANVFEDDRKKAIACGMNGHIGKPIKIERMFEVFKKVFVE